MRRVDCRRCGVVTVEEAPWGDGKRTLTKASMLFLARWARRLSWKETAEAFRTSWDKVFDGLIKDWAYERAAFLDLTEHVQATVAEGDLVVDRFYSTGRQARDLDPIPHHSPGIPNRGKALHMPEMEMFRVVDGKLAEQWLFNDIWGTHAQLGLFDPDNWKASVCAPK